MDHQSDFQVYTVRDDAHNEIYAEIEARVQSLASLGMQLLVEEAELTDAGLRRLHGENSHSKMILLLV